jgi:hypothetical protein
MNSARQRHRRTSIGCSAFFVIEGVASIMFTLEHNCDLSEQWGAARLIF